MRSGREGDAKRFVKRISRCLGIVGRIGSFPSKFLSSGNTKIIRDLDSTIYGGKVASF